MRISKIVYVLGALSALAFLWVRCTDSAGAVPRDPRGSMYAGDAACRSCHKNIYENYLQTAHYNTSYQYSGDTAGNIHNRLQTSIPDQDSLQAEPFRLGQHLWIRIEKRDSILMQVGYQDNRELAAHPFDMAFGSGEKAATYAYWKGKKLYQLPLSHFTQIQNWANSPGFPADRINFDRQIIARCFECHSSYINKELTPGGGLTVNEDLNRQTIIYGIDCERCHGPAAEHVNYHTANPSEKKPQRITVTKMLSRNQQLDACAVCHSGNDKATQKSTFSFKPGDTLSNFYFPEYARSVNTEPDVHGNQLQLLAQSKCFTRSQVLTCNSCHNVHNPRQTIATASVKCMSCHTTPEKDHKVTTAKKIQLTNCIDCHMPPEASKKISFREAGKEKLSAYYLRSHRIGIYPAAQTTR